MSLRLAFLDDDPVIRLARYILENRENDPFLAAYFMPESVDLSRTISAARGITRRDGIDVFLADAEVSDADIVILRRGAIDEAFLRANPRLRLVVKLGERLDDIALGAVRNAGCRVVNISRRTLDYTAEHAILLMLALGKRLFAADALVRKGSENSDSLDGVAYNWCNLQHLRGLSGHTLGLIGLGEVGSRVARLARCFGMRVLYYKRSPLSRPDEDDLQAAYASLDELLAASDYVSLHVSYTKANERLIGESAFSAMRGDAFFINTSRGRLVDEDALYEALSQGRIAGAGLDTHGIEPRAPDDRFSRLDNVIMTPHIAGGARSGILNELEDIFGHIRSVAG